MFDRVQHFLALVQRQVRSNVPITSINYYCTLLMILGDRQDLAIEAAQVPQHCGQEQAGPGSSLYKARLETWISSRS